MTDHTLSPRTWLQPHSNAAFSVDFFSISYRHWHLLPALSLKLFSWNSLGPLHLLWIFLSITSLGCLLFSFTHPPGKPMSGQPWLTTVDKNLCVALMQLTIQWGAPHWSINCTSGHLITNKSSAPKEKNRVPRPQTMGVGWGYSAWGRKG